ncbi:MAG: hypothetical protein AAGC92_07500 [Pseudomonadota bacterium]
MVEILNWDDFTNFYRNRAAVEAVVVAVRAALRMVPLGATDADQSDASWIKRGNATPALRGLLSAAAATQNDTRSKNHFLASASASAFDAARLRGFENDVTAVAKAAGFAADAADSGATGTAADAAVISAEMVASSIEDSVADIWRLVTADAKSIEAGASPSELFNRPLWHEAGMPARLQTDWARLKTYLTETDPRMRFWAEWYQRMLDGDPMDWAMQEEIALLPEEDWQAGPDRIAERIAVIRERYLAKKARLAERMDFDPDTAKFYTTPVDISRPDLLATGLQRIKDALDLTLNRGNGLNADSIEVQILTLTVSRYSHDPQRVEMDCTEVHTMLTAKFASGELPDDDPHRVLSRRLLDTAEHLRAGSEEIAEARDFSLEARLRALTPEQRAELGSELQIEEVLGEQTRQEFKEDKAAIANATGADPIYRGRLRRLVSRVARISLLARSKDVVDKIKNHRGFIGMDIALKIAAAGRWVVRVFYYL